VQHNRLALERRSKLELVRHSKLALVRHSKLALVRHSKLALVRHNKLALACSTWCELDGSEVLAGNRIAPVRSKPAEHMDRTFENGTERRR
jgi:hypothetical protein